jgi:glycogen operon protein
MEKIPYFKELGITSLELLPVHSFDEFENLFINPQTGKRLTNYAGYSTQAFFAPMLSYASDKTPGGCIREFKEMVREQHRNGIEVILDVVFNHTSEGNEWGPAVCFRGLDNSIYYHLEDGNKQLYKNYSGCGNTVNCNHPVVRQLIVDCLRYWMIEMHVDGFRFDLAPILGRARSGAPLPNAPLLEEIAEDPVLAQTKIIAEPWDAGGAYQVGGFAGRWAEWNDRFRDDIRRFWHGEAFLSTAAATRIAGSADIYRPAGKKPFHSINFIACHDGFTLNDIVSYNTKHNEANGEDNRDGSNSNCSYNYGFEGATVNPAIEQVRLRQIKNMFLTLMISQGTPMMLGGDEFRRTQGGNNNAYCQDNKIAWFDWSLKEKNADLFRFCRMAIQFRRCHPSFRRPDFFEGLDHSGDTLPDIAWYNRSGKSPPDWQRLDKFLAFYINGDKTETLARKNAPDFYILCNTDVKDISAALPPLAAGKSWYRCVDTSIPSPEDFLEPGSEESLGLPKVYVLPARSMAVLMAK